MKRNITVILIILLFAGCKQKSTTQAQPETSSAITIEKVKLTWLDGQPVDFKNYKGKTVFINFWATWCKPCIEEMPSIRNAMNALKDKKIDFLFASDESKEEIETFSAKNNLAFNFLKAENQEELEITGLPTTFIFDANGKLVFSEMGARRWDSQDSFALLTKIIEQ